MAHPCLAEMDSWGRGYVDQWYFYGDDRTRVVVHKHGLLFYWIMPDDSVAIVFIFVHPAHRRKGVGSALLANLPRANKNVFADPIDEDHAEFWRCNGFTLVRTSVDLTAALKGMSPVFCWMHSNRFRRVH